MSTLTETKYTGIDFSAPDFSAPSLAEPDPTEPVEAKRLNRGLQIAGIAAIASGLLGIAYWYRRPITPPISSERGAARSLLYEYLPEAEFCGEVSVKIDAPASAIFAALYAVTLDDMPLAKWLGRLRYTPGKVTGKAQQEELSNRVPFMTTLLTEGKNIILDEVPDREVVIGVIGKFHNIVDQQIVPITTPQQFVEFNEPDYQKLAMSFRLTPLPGQSGYRLTLLHCTHALSREARNKFAMYWLAIKPGGNFVSWLMLRAIKTIAEKSIGEKSKAGKATADVAFRSTVQH